MPALFISDLHLSEERAAANERFIAFLENEAQPILEDTGRTLGYLFEGLANSVMGFQPLADDFSFDAGAFIERMRAEKPALVDRGELVVQTRPVAARVSIDGEDRGPAGHDLVGPELGADLGVTRLSPGGA